jgi:penicillin-binding protein 1A
MSDDNSRLDRNGKKKANKKAKQPAVATTGEVTQRPKKTWQSRLKMGLLITATIAALGVLAGAGLFTYYASSAPKLTAAKLSGQAQTVFLDKNGDEFWSSNSQTREVAKSSEIPSLLRQSVVSIEDRRFYKHSGIDIQRIIGAAMANVTGSSLGLQGGSTLTQQLVKLSVFSTAASDQTIKRKAQEAWLSLKLEREYSKSQILTLYMNKVYMGNGVYGFRTAAEYYFGKNMRDLSVPQMALLAGLPQSPSGYDPYTNPAGAKARRDEVLTAMVEYGAISAADAAKYKATAVADGLMTTHASTEDTQEDAKVADAYISSTLKVLKAEGYNVESDNLTVKTNLDMDVQRKAYNLANTSTQIYWPDNDLQLAATVIDPKNGHVISQIGGRQQTGLLGLNRATQTTRSSGSTAKPMVDYGPAVEYLNWPTYRAIDDSKYTYAGTNIQVYNADRQYDGWMTIRNAMAQSRNIPAIRTFEAVGAEKSTEFLKKIGITPKTALTSASAIGIDVSTEQEAAAFAAFDNGGTYYEPQYIQSITSPSGTVKTFDAKGTTAMKSSTAFMLTSMMQSVITDSYAKLVAATYPQAGKTGVVGYDEDAHMPDGAASDVWFTGYTKSAVISTWMGYDHQSEQYVPQDNTSYLHMYFYKYLMNYIMSSSDADDSDWSMPDTVKKVTKYGKTEYEVANADFTDPGLSGRSAASSSSVASSSSSSSVAPATSSSATSTSTSSAPASSSSAASGSSSSAE